MSNSSSHSFLSGLFGGVSLVLVSHPFDLIKVRMQVATSRSTTAWTTMKDAVMGPRGILGLYRGVLPVFAGTPFILGLNLQSYAWAQEYIASMKKIPRKELSYLEIGLAGGLGALPMSCIIGPAEQLKIQLQTSTQNLRFIFKNMITDTQQRKMLRNGIILTALRDVPGGFLYFSAYEYTKALLPPDKYGLIMVPVAGGLAGTWTWLLTLPFDTIKTKIQASVNSKSAFEQLKQAIREGGIKWLFKGLAPTLMRAFPASAAFFAGMEISGNLLDQYFPVQ